MTDTILYEEEFRRFTDVELRGLSITQRKQRLQQWLEDARREGMVPIGENWVCGLTTQHLPHDLDADGVQVDVTGKPSSSKQRALKILAGVLGVLCLLLVVALNVGEPKTSVKSSPITASTYGSMAPISMQIGDRSFTIEAFKSKDGWPDPRGAAMVMYWGETTINQTFAVDGQDLPTVLPETLGIRRADGSQLSYRIVGHSTVERDAVEYTAQDHVGVTVVGFGDDDTLTVIQAVPTDIPTNNVQVDAITVRVQDQQWVVAKQKPLLRVSLVLDVPVSAQGDVILDMGNGVVKTLASLPLADPTVHVDVDRPQTNTLQWRVRYKDHVTPLILDVPSLPVLHVSWDEVAVRDAVLLVSATVTSEGGDFLLTASDVRCGVQNQKQTPVALNGQTLPMVITDATRVTLMCPRSDPNDMVVVIGNQSAVINSR